MRKVILVIAFGLVLVWASPSEANRKEVNCDSGWKSYVYNACVEHPEKKEKMAVGLGLDIPLYISDKLIVDQETKIDLNAGDFGDFEKANIGTYTVFKPQLEEGILQMVWSKVKSLLGG